ncbi:MAG: hypothetical protein L0G99_11570 [Propionibacteriales bacterium]|nr:hypothetical protein [Propionibacteriales bacterium]
MGNDGVRDLTAEDLDWVLDLSEARRRRLASYAPRFWNPADNARTRHATFLGDQIDNPEIRSLRTDHGFVFAAPGRIMIIDDLAVADEALWPTEGVALLRRAGGDSLVRVVCPVPEPRRRDAVRSLGLELAESWWTKNLASSTRIIPYENRHLRVPGAAGKLVTAPPVYSPGGPVLLITEADGVAAMAELEHQATVRGARVAVVSQPGADVPDGAALREAGYTRTSDFHHGRL